MLLIRASFSLFSWPDSSGSRTGALPLKLEMLCPKDNKDKNKNKGFAPPCFSTGILKSTNNFFSWWKSHFASFWCFLELREKKRKEKYHC
jgi:hypothetical protein